MVKFWLMQVRMRKVSITNVPEKYREAVVKELKKLEALYEK
jgi:hypothetical protein